MKDIDPREIERERLRDNEPESNRGGKREIVNHRERERERATARANERNLRDRESLRE